MTYTRASDPAQDLVIRSYKQPDQQAVWQLYHEGLLAGQISPNDTAADMENVADAYFEDPRNNLWVAEADGLVGMIGVAAEREHTAEIRRLRVKKDWQGSALAGRLIETALAHCKQHAYVKVVFDTRFERQAAVDLFERFGFQHTRTKPVHGKELLEFYLDLYRPPRPEKDS